VPGTYNVSNAGPVSSWADITREIFKISALSNTVTDITTADYCKDKPEAAPRPLKSTLKLDKIKAVGFQPKDWRHDLHSYIIKEMQSPRLDAAQGAGKE